MSKTPAPKSPAPQAVESPKPKPPPRKDGDLSAAGLFASDPELKAHGDAYKRYSAVAPMSDVKTTAAALETLGHKATICNTNAEALDAIVKLAKAEGGVYGQGGSTTLAEVGWIKWLKDNPSTFQRNTKSEALEATGKSDWAGAAKANKDGLSADLFFTSVCAVTHKGEILACDLTGTRVGALPHAAKKVVIVIGANKIVPTMVDAERRMTNYCLPWESARCRIVFAAAGLKASSINNTCLITATNPFAPPNRIHVVIVNQSLGF